MARINVVLDMSKYDMFLLCPQRFQYRYEMNKELPQKAKPLDRGNLMHVANEFYYEGIRQNIKYQERVDLALMKMKQCYAMELNSAVSQEDFNWIVDTMIQYYDHWRFKDESMIIRDVEKPFLKVLYEDEQLRIALSGKIDLFIEESREFYPMDTKSMERNREVIRLNNQFRCYCWATDTYKAVVNKIGLQTSLKPHDKFLRVPVTYDNLMIDDWKQNVINNVFKYIECVGTGIWPMNETSCDKYNRKCEYLDICESSGKEAKFFKLNNNYVTVEPWDVTKILKKSSELLNEKANEKANEQPRVE